MTPGRASRSRCVPVSVSLRIPAALTIRTFAEAGNKRSVRPVSRSWEPASALTLWAILRLNSDLFGVNRPNSCSASIVALACYWRTGRSGCRSVLHNISGCRMLVAALDGKRLAQIQFWSGYGIHPGADRHRRESAVRRDVPGPPGTPALGRDLQQPAPGRPGLATGGGQGGSGLLRRPQPRAPDVSRLRGAHVAAEPRDRGEHPAVIHVCLAGPDPAGVRGNADDGATGSS
jgi:hypothetical protein